jgi:dCTP deaminase
MIWPDWLLRKWLLEAGGLKPYDMECVNPASVDLRWSGRYRRALDTGVWSEVYKMQDHEHLVIRPGELVLMDTLETICMPSNCCGMITLKSSIGRMGLEHMHAGFFDPGFHGTGTLEMYGAAPWPIKIKPMQRIVQIVLMELHGYPDDQYNGRYQGDLEPMPYKGVSPNGND